MAILEWVEKAAQGHEVSDFAQSFPLVLTIVDLRRQLDERPGGCKTQGFYRPVPGSDKAV